MSGMQQDRRQRDQQDGDAGGEDYGGALPRVRGLHRLRLVDADHDGQVAVGDAVEIVDTLDTVERGPADPDSRQDRPATP